MTADDGVGFVTDTDGDGFISADGDGIDDEDVWFHVDDGGPDLEESEFGIESSPEGPHTTSLALK